MAEIANEDVVFAACFGPFKERKLRSSNGPFEIVEKGQVCENGLNFVIGVISSVQGRWR